jgi:hypothetical protein
MLLIALGGCDGCRTRAPEPPGPAAVRYLKGQLHLHSSRSGDSRTAPEDVVRWYREHGFDFIVFTDHNRAGPSVRSTRPLVLSGIELTQNLAACSPPPEAGERCLFHVNGLFLGREAAGLEPWRPKLLPDRRAAYRQAIAAATQAGGIAQLNHPNFHHGADAALLTTLVREESLRFFEVANGSFDAGNAGDATHPSTEELWDRTLTAGAWLYGTATDDAHHYYDAGTMAAPTFPAGRGFVMVRASLDEPSIRAATLRGDFYASTGVLLDRAEVADGALVVTVAGRELQAHTFTFIGTGGRRLAHTRGHEARFALADAPAGYLRAVVEDGQEHKAWVQPVRVPPSLGNATH